MDKFSIVLEENFFEKFMNNKAEYIILLNNTKNRALKQDNILTIVNKSNQESYFEVKIESLFYFENMKDMFTMVGKDKFGYRSSDNVDYIEDRYVSMFKDAQVLKNGVIAVKVVKIN